LKYQDKDVRVVVDREDPRFFVDDIVAATDIDCKECAITRSALCQNRYTNVKFDRIFVTDPDGKETLHEITNSDGAFGMALHADPFGTSESEPGAKPNAELKKFIDWLSEANDLIDEHWYHRVEDFRTRMEIEPKNRGKAVESAEHVSHPTH
jgi:hypothetical protein